MSTVNEKLTRLKHLVELGNRTKTELDILDGRIQDIITQGGEPNSIEEIWLNGVKQTPDADKAVKLEVAHPEYSIVKAEDSGEYAAVYNLTKNGEIVGATINIPKDMVVKSGSVVGDKIVLVLNDEAATEIEIPVGSLIEYVTTGSQAGDMVVIAVDEVTHKVTATITDGSITLDKLAADVQTAIGKAHEHANAKELDKIVDGDVAKWNSAQANAEATAAAALAAAKTELNGEIADAQSAAEQKATDLNTAMDTRVKVLEAIDHEAYKGYADQAEADALAAAKEYANSLASNYDADGSAAQALVDAKEYVDGQIASDAEVTAALDVVFGTTSAA